MRFYINKINKKLMMLLSLELNGINRYIYRS